MARLAGDSRTYPLRIIDPLGNPTDFGPDLISSTSVIKSVLGSASGGMRYSGFKLGLQAASMLEHDLVLEGEDLEEVYIAAKATEFDPNKNMRSAGTRGTKAHDLLESLVKGKTILEHDGETIVAVRLIDEYQPDPGEAYLEVRRTLESYELAVARWWIQVNQPGVAFVAEHPLWNLREGYAGTTDIVVIDSRTEETSIGDLKTHKPRTNRSGVVYLDAPGFPDDLLQVDSYALAWESMGLGAIDHTFVLVALEDGTMLEDHRETRRGAFLDVLSLYRALEEVS